MADPLLSFVLQQGTFRSNDGRGWSGVSCHSATPHMRGLTLMETPPNRSGRVRKGNPLWPGFCLSGPARGTVSWSFPGDFCFEFWFDAKNIFGAYWQCLVNIGASSSAGPGLYSGSSTGKERVLSLWHNSGMKLAHQNLVPASGVVHAVLQRVSGVATLYLQGVPSEATYAWTGEVTSDLQIFGGANTEGLEGFLGEMYGYRITNAARFSGAFDWTLETIEEVFETQTQRKSNAVISKYPIFPAFGSPWVLLREFDAGLPRPTIPAIIRPLTYRLGTVSWAAGRDNIGLTGTVAIKGTPLNTPVARPVVLYSMTSKLPVGATMSKSDGTYQFRNLNPNEKYFAVAFDPSGFYRPVIADNLPTQNLPV